MSRELAGKAIVITGASSGIGAATAVACGAAGMQVALAARREDKLAEATRRVEAAGGEAIAVACDVTKDDDVRRLFERARGVFGRVDALFANAGYGIVHDVLATPDDAHRELFEVNYWGTIRTLRHGVPALRATPDGLRHVLICSSAASEIGIPRHGPYSATKAAQDAIASAMRAELATPGDAGIAVTSVHPIGTKTEFFDTAADRSGNAQSQLNTPGAMMQSADHVARRVVAALRQPKAEVWPSRPARLGLALCTAWPGLAAWVLRRQARQAREAGHPIAASRDAS